VVTSGLHRNSAYLERRAALASLSDASGMSGRVDRRGGAFSDACYPIGYGPFPTVPLRTVRARFPCTRLAKNTFCFSLAWNVCQVRQLYRVVFASMDFSVAPFADRDLFLGDPQVTQWTRFVRRFPLVASSSLEAGSDESSTVVLVILCGIGQQASTLVGPADGGSITATWVQAIQSSPYTT
jgi:hypothetical protein